MSDGTVADVVARRAPIPDVPFDGAVEDADDADQALVVAALARGMGLVPVDRGVGLPPDWVTAEEAARRMVERGEG